MQNRNRYTNNVNGRDLNYYKKMIDWDLCSYEERLKVVKKIFSLDENGMSTDEFWLEVWDSGICQAYLNKTDTLWSETDVAKFFTTIESYLIYGYQKKEKKYRNELELNEKLSTEDIIKNDKNYRLAPPETIEKADYDENYMRDLFKGTYEEYVQKVSKTNYEIKDEYSFDRIKYNELEKIKYIKEFNKNLKILKKQMEIMKEKGGNLQFNNSTYAIINPLSNINISLSKQLERYGLDNSEILELENNYPNKKRPTSVALYHLTNDIRDIKDNRLLCKLAYNNRVMIRPNKCSSNYNVLDNVDYLEPTHIKGMLLLGEMSLDPSKDLSIIAYDINKKIEDMYSNGQLSNRDMYIIEGIRHNITYKKIGEELDIRPQTVEKNINRICNNISKSIYNDYIDLYFLNNKKGTYKKCNKCGEVKLINKFFKNIRRKDGHENCCKECQSKKK